MIYCNSYCVAQLSVFNDFSLVHSWYFSFLFRNKLTHYDRISVPILVIPMYDMMNQFRCLSFSEQEIAKHKKMIRDSYHMMFKVRE